MKKVFIDITDILFDSATALATLKILLFVCVVAL